MCEFLSTLDASDILNTILIGISLLFIGMTLWQNHKILESSTRPYVVIYGTALQLNKKLVYYLIIKNFGASAAHITKLEYPDEILSHFDPGTIDPLNNIRHTTLAPGQAVVIGFSLGDDEFMQSHFTISYRSQTKKYSDEFTINLSSALAANKPRNKDHADDPIVIKDLLNEFVERSL